MRALPLAVTWLLCIAALASAGNNTTEGPPAMPGDDGDPGTGDTVVWIVVVASLLILIFAYGRIKQAESKRDLDGRPADEEE